MNGTAAGRDGEMIQRRSWRDIYDLSGSRLESRLTAVDKGLSRRSLVLH